MQHVLHVAKQRIRDRRRRGRGRRLVRRLNDSEDENTDNEAVNEN